MWDNLCRHVDRLVAARHTCLVEPATAAAPRDDGAHCSGELAGRAVLDQRHTTRSERTRWRFCEIHALSVQGLSMPMIARRLRLNFKTVRRYLRADSVEQLVAGGVRASKLYPFKPYLHQRLTASVRSATALHAQIVTQGYTGIYNIVERYLKPMRRTDAATLAQVLRNRPPPVRQVTAWITGLPGHLDTGFEEAVTQSECLEGRGVGRRLLVDAQQASGGHLALHVFTRNERARQFYAATGFVLTSQSDGSGNEEREPDCTYAWSALPRSQSQ